jgi:hypothetical protein
MDVITEQETLTPQSPQHVSAYTEILLGTARMPASITDPVFSEDPSQASGRRSHQPQLT